MKKVLAVLLIAVAVAYYFGYDVTDFIPSWSTSNNRPARVKRAPAPAEQPRNAPPAPAQSSGGSSVVANSSDGSLTNRWSGANANSYDGSLVDRWCPYGSGASLANRWQSYPSPSPKKP